MVMLYYTESSLRHLSSVLKETPVQWVTSFLHMDSTKGYKEAKNSLRFILETTFKYRQLFITKALN